MNGDVRKLADLASAQHGSILDQQAVAAGLTSRKLARRVAAGNLARIGTHVVRSPFVESTPLADLAAFVLECGPGAVASGLSAAALHGFDGFELTPPFHATLPRGRCVDRRPHVVHTALELDPIDRTLVRAVPTMAVPRTLIDLTRFVSRARLTVALDSALRDRRTTEDRLHQRIVALRSKGRYGIPALLEVIEGSEAIRGGHSWLERRFFAVCARAGLPRPLTQRVAATAGGRLVRVDFEFMPPGLVVEVLGYRWHRGSRQQLDRDVERLNALTLAGRPTLQFTYDHVTGQPEWIVDQLRRALGELT